MNQHSIRNSLKGRFGTSQRLASIGAESMASTRHPFRQSRAADIAALLGGGTSKGNSKDVLAAMDRYEDSFDDDHHVALAAVTNQTLSTGQNRRASAGTPCSQGPPRGNN